jgi:hypothetical protein
MAEHHWLGQRALVFQGKSFDGDSDPARIAVYLRYQIAQDRAFHKTMKSLQELRKEKIGFESQKLKSELKPLEVARAQERHEVEMCLKNNQAEAIRIHGDAKILSEPHRPRLPHIPTALSAEFFNKLFDA